MGKEKILLVDDDPLALKTLTGFLQGQGYTVVGVSSGEEALRTVRLDPPDLVLLDLVMPGMDGLKVLRFIKGDPLMKTLTVILLTSRGEPRDVVRGLKEGADDYLIKPLNQEELLARVQAHLRYKAVLEALEREKAYIGALYEITRELAMSRDYYQILHTIARRVAALLEVYRCSIVLREERGRAQIVASNEDPSIKGTTVNLSDYPEIVRSLETGKSVIIRDIDVDPLMDRVRGVLQAKGIRTIMVFPIPYRDSVIGVLFLRGGKVLQSIPEENLRICEAIATATAPALVKVTEIASLKEEVRLKERYEFLFSNASDGLLTVDTRGRIREVNDSLLRLIGYSKGELEGSSFVGFVAPESREDAREIFKKFLTSTPPSRFDIQIRGKDGKIFIFSATASVLPGDEKKALFSMRDVTERRKLSAELERTTEELREKEKKALIAELTGAAAHELNQPLTAILGLADILLRDLDQNDPRLARIKDITQQAERMADIVKKISRITRYETKPYPGGRRIFDLEMAEKTDEVKKRNGT